MSWSEGGRCLTICGEGDSSKLYGRQNPSIHRSRCFYPQGRTDTQGAGCSSSGRNPAEDPAETPAEAVPAEEPAETPAGDPSDEEKK